MQIQYRLFENVVPFLPSLGVMLKFASILPEGGTRLCDINHHDGRPDPPRNTQAITATANQCPAELV